MSVRGKAFLVADIGGTNARFALAEERDGEVVVGPLSIFQTHEHASLEEALRRFLDEQGNPDLAAAGLCAAGPVKGEGDELSISMTNCPWQASLVSLAEVTGLSRLRLMNDYEALAFSLPGLKTDDLQTIGPALAERMNAPRCVLGAGTGLGVAGLLRDGDRDVVVASEGGHVDLAATDSFEADVLALLQARFGHVSVERVLSGSGLQVLYEAVSMLAGREGVTAPMPQMIAQQAMSGECEASASAIRLFCGWLGAAAGNFALTFGAWSGVYIGGGIVPGWLAAMPGLFNEALFRERFEAKGRFGAMLSAVPVHVIRKPDAAMLGLARALRQAD